MSIMLGNGGKQYTYMTIIYACTVHYSAGCIVCGEMP